MNDLLWDKKMRSVGLFSPLLQWCPNRGFTGSLRIGLQPVAASTEPGSVLTKKSSDKEPNCVPITYQVRSGRIMGRKISLEQRRSLDLLQGCLHRKNTDISDAKASALLD